MATAVQQLEYEEDESIIETTEPGSPEEAYVELFGEFDEDDFNDRYIGEYDSELDYTYQLIDDCGYLSSMPDFLQNYFDYESFSRDIFAYEYVSAESEGGDRVYIFRND